MARLTSSETRFDPDNGDELTFIELLRRWEQQYTDEEIILFWEGLPTTRPPSASWSRTEERRYDPEDGTRRTYAELQRFYKKSYDETEIKAYWQRLHDTKPQEKKKLTPSYDDPQQQEKKKLTPEERVARKTALHLRYKLEGPARMADLHRDLHIPMDFNSYKDALKASRSDDRGLRFRFQGDHIEDNKLADCQARGVPLPMKSKKHKVR